MIQKGTVPEIQIGIISGKEINFSLNSLYSLKNATCIFTGECTAALTHGKIVLSGNDNRFELEEPVLLVPEGLRDSSFTLRAVTIGVDFHWQRNEDQVFRGSLKLIIEDGMVTAVNIISVEDYLTSVISS